jgi:hypothetical protein
MRFAQHKPRRGNDLVTDVSGTQQGMTKHFRQQMITEMENQLERYKQGRPSAATILSRLILEPVPPNQAARPKAPSAIPLGVGEKSPLRVLTSARANGRRKLMTSPVGDS